ncbi:lymphocyte activation gene 3 protein [Hippoglossus stenolepis]|uniref:lymphocyte activation gene 3 protein n=1 Tax=Hippoglossus stenolepis TaxID=195615 RepID=UPI00159C1435|nr:lymphocyte activation gene 3 protein [Hippoglossus stenolepis]
MMLLECFIFILITFLTTGVQCEVTEVFAEAGSPAVLPCKYSPTSNVSPGIIWSKVTNGTVWRKQKSGVQLWGSSWSEKGIQRVRCPHNQFERGDYSLQILRVREEDGGVYSCRVEQGDRVDETVVMLRIITVSISPLVPIWGRDISVTCQVTPGFDAAAAVQWMLNDSRFSRQTRVTSPGDTLKSIVTEKASARLTGNWTCVVGYKGKEGRASATLTVTGIIQPPSDDTKVYAAVGSAVTLPCVFSSGLNPSSPLWEKLQTGSLNKRAPSRFALFSPSSPSSQLPWDKSASLKEVDLKDEGRYRCSGTIKGQRLARNIQLVVAKIDSSVPSKKKRSVTLTCQLSDTSEVTEYEWVRVTNDLNQAFGPIHKGQTLSISLLSEESRDTWACRFSGKDGILGNITTMITYNDPMMSSLSGQKASGTSQNTAAVVGLSLLLLALLLILAQMYKNHRRKQGIFQYPAMETIIQTVSNEREEREKHRVKVLP